MNAVQEWHRHQKASEPKDEPQKLMHILYELAQALRHPGCGCDGTYVCAICYAQIQRTVVPLARRLRDADRRQWLQGDATAMARLIAELESTQTSDAAEWAHIEALSGAELDQAVRDAGGDPEKIAADMDAITDFWNRLRCP
jgi:hypothetical protein